MNLSSWHPGEVVIFLLHVVSEDTEKKEQRSSNAASPM